MGNSDKHAHEKATSCLQPHFRYGDQSSSVRAREGQRNAQSQSFSERSSVFHREPSNCKNAAIIIPYQQSRWVIENAPFGDEWSRRCSIQTTHRQGLEEHKPWLGLPSETRTSSSAQAKGNNETQNLDSFAAVSIRIETPGQNCFLYRPHQIKTDAHVGHFQAIDHSRAKTKVFLCGKAIT